MKKYLFSLLFVICTSSILGQNDKVYVYLDPNYKNLFNLKIAINKDKTLFHGNLKILDYEKRNEGYINVESKRKPNELVKVAPQIPMPLNYTEFFSFEKPLIIQNIKDYNFYNVIDLSKKGTKRDEILLKNKGGIFFIEKTKSTYRIWNMHLQILE